MNVRCPTCGAEVEFRYDDSFVRVCGHCRAAVVRTDRGAETLGRFADLAPVSSTLRLFAEGRYGTTGLLLVGMAQLRHAAGGVWQEWYAKLDGGQWAWLSEAQGRLYLTFERPDVAVPSIAMLAPGTQITLAGAAFTVAERGTATYTSALGEIPYRLVPNSTFQFVDLSDGRGGFATIDYGDGGEPPAVYLGYQVTPQGLGLSGGEAPQVVAPATGARLACPNCNGSLELRAPDQTLRVACPYCGALVSVESGILSIIAQQQPPPPGLDVKPTLEFQLGSKGKLLDGELTVIGFVERSALIDEDWWPFQEYLLYAPDVGFRWLVCSEGHWSYVQPVATGAVTLGKPVSYDGVDFEPFQVAEIRVDRVVGEFYWRVAVGEQVSAEDYVAPPAMLSREVTMNEQNWSLSRYMTRDELEVAFGRKLRMPWAPVGVAPNQPYRGARTWTLWLAMFVLFAIGTASSMRSSGVEKLRHTVGIPPAGRRITPEITAGAGSAADITADPAASVMFSPPFALDAGQNIRVDLSANVNNNWVYVVVDLINDETGAVVSFDKAIEHYSGSDDEGAWSEGSQSDDVVLGPVSAGAYVLRIEGQHGGTNDVTLDVVVRQGVFRWPWFGLGFAAIALPFLVVSWRWSAFRKERWSNSNLSTQGYV